MDEQRANETTIRGLFAHVAELRQDLAWIAETTRDPNTKLQVAHVLARSLKMPPDEAKE